MKSPLALVGAMAIASAVTGCGSASHSTTRAMRPPAVGGASSTASAVHGDYDNDDTRARVDDDSITVRRYGHEANRSQSLLISGLVGRYFAAAAAGDGARGCAMLDPSLVKAVPLDYGRYGPAYLRGGKSCPEILSRLYSHEHRLLAAEARVVRVDRVRLEGREGFAILALRGAPERQISIAHEAGRWTVQTLLDGPMRLAP